MRLGNRSGESVKQPVWCDVSFLGKASWCPETLHLLVLVL